MRLVLDTNLYVSALLSSRGAPGRLPDLARTGRFVLVTSPPQIDELARVLGYERLRTRIQPAQAATLLQGLPHAAEVVEALPAVRLSADPDDNVILATAIAGRAHALATGDKRHLLTLGDAAGIPIVTATRMLAQLEPSRP